MFYSYDLSFDRASSLSHTLALTVTNSEAATAGTRKNGSPVVLNAAGPQNVCGQGFTPFSSDFSFDFGGNTNYVLVTVNKFLRMAGAELVSLPTPTKFHPNSQAVHAVSSQIAHIAVKHLGTAFLAALFGEAVRLSFARPNYVVVAAKAPESIGVRRAIFKLLPSYYVPLSGFSSGFSSGFGPLLVYGMSSSAAIVRIQTKVFRWATSETTSLSRSVIVTIRVITTEALAAAIKVAGKGLSSALPLLAASALKTVGKLPSAAESMISSVVRALPWRISAASSEAARLGFGGGNLFARAFNVLAGEGMALQRGQAVLRGLLNPDVAGLMRTPSKISAATDSEIAGLLKQSGIPRAASDGQSVASKRQAGLVKGVAGPTILVLQTAASHVAAAYSAVSAQVASLFTQHVIGRSLSLPRPQSNSVSLSSLRTLLRSISVASPQTIRIARAMTTAVAVLTGAAPALVRGSGKILAVASSGVTFLLSVTLHFFIGSVASPQVIAQRASHSALKGVASPETAAIAQRRGALLSATAANVASVRRRLTTLLASAQQQVASVSNAIAKSIAVAFAEVAAAIRGASRASSTASQESAALITRHGSALGAISSAQVSALRRLTNRLLLAFSGSAASGGRGGTKLLPAKSPSSALMLRPRGLAIGASHGLVARNVVYFHFFVAPWAYQQTTLLPPSGGPAEPPSFGPIDPADQTIFGFDWSSRAYPNDTIISAVVTCVPPGLPFLPGSLFISGTLIQITVSPMPEPALPTVFSLRCSATFSSGRVSSFSIPVPVRTL